ncbi:unnamed protein product [Urochloa decumbens]|uniref:CSC1-like protein ERD4 n=1 Tax=Urochloa decumbens TaxID=240449 RepID=A0ABC9FLY5_9POAL
MERLALGNVQPSSTRLWAFLLSVYWVSFVTYFVLWKSYKHVSNLRATARSTPDVKPEEFAVLVRDVPRSSPDETIKDSVDSYFRALHPNTFYRSMVVTDHTKADKIYLEIEDHKKKIARAEVVYANSKTESNPEGTKPTHRTGFLGLIGKKVDTIEYCSEQIKELLPKLEAEQKTTLRDKQQRAAIVFFNSRSAAASASQTLHAQVFDKWTVMEAPEPREIIWSNLSRNIYERFFVGYGLELSRVVPLIIFHLKRKYLCKTEDDVRAAWYPSDLGYSTRVPNDMLITTVVLCYSVMAPLIIPFGVAYFALGWLIAKNQVLRVYVPSYESNGRMWPHMHTRIIAALLLYQATMIGVIGLKKFLYSPILVPLLPISIIFAYICHMRFYPAFANTPLEVAQHELKETPNMDAIYTAYIPPCLKPDKLEDLDVYEDAQSHSTSRAPSI